MRRWCLRLIVVAAAWWQVAISDPQIDHLADGCSNVPAVNVTDFYNALNATFSDLKSQVMMNKTFALANHTVGPETVFAVLQCRKYMSENDCLRCYEVAQSGIRNNCNKDPVSRGARFLLQGCFLRYEAYDFTGKATDTALNCSSQDAPQPETFGSERDGLVGDLVRAAPELDFSFAANKKVVSKSESLTVYGMAQCLESVTAKDCRVCLEAAFTAIKQCRSANYGDVWDAACYIRYSNISFFTDDHITPIPPDGSKVRKIIIGVSVGVTGLVLISFFLLWYKFSRQLRNALIANILGATELQNPNRYSYSDLKAATNGFSEANKLGQGAFGVVYKANLENGNMVAVKKLNMSNRRAKEDYETEVRLISNVHHRNLLRFLGCCSKGSELLLVLEYMENGSLDRYLYGNRRGSLNWKQRFDIILGTARGLAYLHEHYFATMIHRDIKPANILVDNQFQPKIADFGLAKLLPENQTHLSSGGFAGTLGYTAPEYALGGHLSEKVDVYSFGLVVLEIISGKRCTDLSPDSDNGYLLKNAWDLYERDRHQELVDKALNSNGEEVEELKKMVEIALGCTQSPPSLRPTMSQVLYMLTQHRLPEQRPPLRPNHIQSITSSTHFVTTNAY